MKLFPDGTAPSNDQGDQVEADLDLEWAGAIARNATLIYVYGTDADQSAFFAIDQNLAPIVSESFGICEAQAQSSPSQYEAEAKKGNAMGITWLVASGDSGAAGCDYDATAASNGLAVNFPASVPEITAVGGTEFNEASGNYWSSVNGANGGSALGYIPEIAWNDTVSESHAEPSRGDRWRRQQPLSEAGLASRSGSSGRRPAGRAGYRVGGDRTITTPTTSSARGNRSRLVARRRRRRCSPVSWRC